MNLATADAPGPEGVRVVDAATLIAGRVTPITATESVPVGDALGRVLSFDVPSPIDVPAHDNSAMDGYAVRGADLDPTRLTWLDVVGTAFAGSPSSVAARPGEAVRVMTGAVMPAGLDTVVVQEVVRVEGARVGIPPGQMVGQNRRLRGEDLTQGRPALIGGRILTPADLGLLASLGIDRIPVRPRVRVAILSTGNEVIAPGLPLPPGCIYDSNRFTLRGMLARLGCEVIDLGIVPDEPTALERTLADAASNADAIISSGGVSVGEADFTREVMNRLGEVDFWRIAMRPGRPLAFGRIGKALYFGLPGNPVAVMVTFHFFVQDALRRLGGALPQERTLLRARSAATIRKKPGRTEYQRGILRRSSDGEIEVVVTGQQGSGVLRSMSEANCMIVLGHEQRTVAAGESVDVLPFEGLV
jgi:molybdopterin molybdotransferase